MGTLKENIKKVFGKMKRPQKISILCLLCLLVFSIIMVFVSISEMNEESDAAATPELRTDVAMATDEAVLLETEDAGQEYVDNTLFLGDSNTVRFLITEQTLSEEKITSWQDYATVETPDRTYTSENNTIAVVGMSISGIDTLECEETSLGTLTMVDAVSYIQPARIIITMGTNDLDGGVTSGSVFAQEYEAQLKKLAAASGNTDIIVNAIPPVAKDTVYSATCSNEQITEYNAAIQDICKNNGWFYLNSTEALTDAEGNAKEGYTAADGIHLTNDGMDALFAYIRCHACNSQTIDASSSDIELYGPLYDMIETNPLNHETVDPAIYGNTQSNTQIQAVTAAPEPAVQQQEAGAVQNAEEAVTNDNSLTGEETEVEDADVSSGNEEEQVNEKTVEEEAVIP